ncbi:nucleotidyltransferase domain-containing protein [Bacillus sp. SB49]|uniref:nucleotidyltransferase domain-containing protein n=1 Tax=Bacillus sp. SB49 TaxID=1071080 RepID=UPI003FA40A58
MRDFPGRWWVAGGWAVDLHIGEETRHHHNVDIALIEPEDSSFFRDWSPLGTSPSGSLRVSYRGGSKCVAAGTGKGEVPFLRSCSL